jgi:hypothetical protein
VQFTLDTSRPLDPAEDSEKLKTLTHAARTGDMGKLLPPRFPRQAPSNVNALAIAPSSNEDALAIISADYDPQDVDALLELYDERQPFTGQKQNYVRRLFAFSSKQPPRKPSCLSRSPAILCLCGPEPSR